MGRGSCQTSEAFKVAVTRGGFFRATAQGSKVDAAGLSCVALQNSPKPKPVIVLAGMVIVVSFRTADCFPLNEHIVRV